jgi:hypothetical protein
MNHQIELFSVVALIEDIPSRQLSRGQVGTVVEMLSPNIYEVEFCDNEGRTYAMTPLKADQLMILHHQPVQA